MNQSDTNDTKTTSTEAAWEKLQTKLATEPVNAQWVRWSKQANELAKDDTINKDDLNPDVVGEGAAYHLESTNTLPQYPTEDHRSGLWLKWMKQNRKWLSGTVAASVLAVTLFTPVGNQALAAILNQFRMEQVTVIQESDIQQMMNNVFTDGHTAEEINKFGTFSNTSGTISGVYTLSQAEKLLNRKLIMPKDADLSKVNISPSKEITLNLHVDEVNTALKSLGAKKLLPQSIDGKPIKFIFDEWVNVTKKTTIDGKPHSYTFLQMKAPVVDVDPSIPVDEAMDAVVKLPFLPEYIKQNLKDAGALDNGKLPLPVITNGTVEKRTIDGVDVVMTVEKYNVTRSKDSVVEEQSYYGLTWIKNGQLYRVNGDEFADSNEAFSLAEELIKQ